MEKIYLEENKNKKKFKFDASVVLSFVVAAFAIVSLVSFGFRQTSYAMPTDTNNINEFNFLEFVNPSGESNITVSGSDGMVITGYTVPIMFAQWDTSGRYYTAYCIEHKVGIPQTAKYQFESENSDVGLLYLLNEAGDSSVGNITDLSSIKISNADSDMDEYIKHVYIYQTAIWVYLNETASSNANNVLSQEELNVIKNGKSLQLLVSAQEEASSTVDFERDIRPLVDAAKTASSNKDLSVKFDGTDISKVDGGKYYQTPIVNVTSSTESSLIGYDVEVDGFDSSAIVVDEEGKKIDNLTNLSKGTKFYIRVPADKVTEKSQNLTVQVKGHFNSLDGSIYSSGANQKVITVTGKTIDKVSGDSIEIVGVPNTGMSTAQTVYFIGLIVLLCGVGIVYANAKPVQDK